MSREDLEKRTFKLAEERISNYQDAWERYFNSIFRTLFTRPPRARDYKLYSVLRLDEIFASLNGVYVPIKTEEEAQLILINELS